MLNILIILVFLIPFSAFSAQMSSSQLEIYNNTDEVHYVAEMAVKTGDNKRCPYVILDKKNATIYVFDKDGLLLGKAPVLLGMAVGDELSYEIARLPISRIKASDRITPSGRFIGEIGIDTHGKEVFWVDFNGNLAIHPVINVPKQDRIERLNSKTIEDNRISWGCINVPKIFFKNYILNNFSRSKGMVYILPEVKSIKDCLWFEK